MDKKEKAEFQDNILDRLRSGNLDKETLAGNFIGGDWESNFEDVVAELIDWGYIEVTTRTKDGTRLKISFRGKRLIEEGGFVEERKKQLEANKNLMQSALQGSRIKDLQEKELKQKIRNNRFTLPIAITSIIISLSTLCWSIFKPFNNLPETIDESRLLKIEKSMESLEKNLKQENDSLKSKLKDAEIIIDTYKVKKDKQS